MWWDVCLSIFMVLESAHLLSPILLAWSRRELRAIVLREWIRHIVCPLAVIVGATLAPATQVYSLYWAWNTHHFAMQNFGTLQLYRDRSTPDQRVRCGLLCLGITGVGFGILPFYFPPNSLPGLLIILVFSLDHWLIDIGLSSRVARQWGFAAIVLAFGVAWLLLRRGPLSASVLPQIIAVRAGLGMAHIMYSSWIWKLSDPQVRQAMTRAFPKLAGAPRFVHVAKPSATAHETRHCLVKNIRGKSTP
jgi:hypothetical protein